MIGHRSGRLLVIGTAPYNKYSQTRWRCRCDCGTETIVRDYDLNKSIPTISCGCRQREIARAPRKHGHTVNSAASLTYRSWKAMLQRCENPACPSFNRYGGRGIAVCERWHSFENFLVDMGPRPLGKTLDRWPDNDGGYSLDNCRWATPKEQQANRNRKEK